jgi:hypothetical protein
MPSNQRIPKPISLSLQVTGNLVDAPFRQLYHKTYEYSDKSLHDFCLWSPYGLS